MLILNKGSRLRLQTVLVQQPIFSLPNRRPDCAQLVTFPEESHVRQTALGTSSNGDGREGLRRTSHRRAASLRATRPSSFTVGSLTAFAPSLTDNSVPDGLAYSTTSGERPATLN